MDFYPHVIGGAEVESRDGARYDSVNPYVRMSWAQVALGSVDDANDAVTAARRAFDEGPWSRMGFAERGRILHRLADLVELHAEQLAHADTRDMGKPISQSRDADVPRAARNLRFFADHARLSTNDMLPMDTEHHAYTRFEPAGVVAAIAPWNFPLMLETWKIAPALTWGNTVVLKPAEDSPTSATMLARLALEAGAPPGVLNVVHGLGPNAVGQALTEHPGVDRVTFTGESGTGRVVARAAAANLTPVSLELGGKGASVVFADADLNCAVEWSARAVFTNSGQVCLAGSRIYVQREIYDEFVDRLVETAEAMVVGDPERPETQIGPLASEQHHAKVRDYVETIESEGGKIETGGLGDGWTVLPTVAVDLPARSRHVRDEIFGPVATVAAFETEADAVAMANDTPYGLNAMLFTENLSRAHRCAARLKTGNVWVNCFFVRDLRAPFGGVGDSGLGREGGNFSREFFTEPKAVVMTIDAEERDAAPVVGSKR